MAVLFCAAVTIAALHLTVISVAGMPQQLWPGAQLFSHASSG